LRPSDARDRRKRGSAGCQLHEFAAEEFHPRPPCMIPS
jgi:hypothetical protein